MTKDEALKLALEALISCELSNYGRDWVWPVTAHEQAMKGVKEAITAIKEALAQPERPWAGLDHDELIERANQEECASVFSKGAIWGAARLREKNA